MLREEITIKNKFGLHTRAAAKLVSLASHYESKIELQLNDQLANCKSIMAIITLGVSKGVALNLVITGADELEARDAIVALVDNRFDEKE